MKLLQVTKRTGMDKAHGLRQPSPPMSLGHAKAMQNGGRTLRNRAAVPPRGAFSAQMLRPPSTPTFSADNSLLQPEYDGDFSSELYDDYAFVTSRREPSEVGNQALSPPPPPPPLPHSNNSRRPVMPRTAVSMVRSPSVKNLANRQVWPRTAGNTTPNDTSCQLQSTKSNNGDQPRSQSCEKPTPSVHPIDTLSKKLRQQAKELTQVYEELEKQNLQLESYKQQILEQKLQLEDLRAQRRKSIEGSSKAATSSRAAALNQQKRAAQMMIGTPSTGASLTQKRGELDRKVKEVEKEKRKYELAVKRIEKALVELQVFQNDRLGKLLPRDGVSNQREDGMTAPGDLEAVVNEQRAYIRVLEEAVHLKATDFEVTGHEELLIVLAELRHTIYEQEKEVEQKSSLLSSIQEQLEREQQQHEMDKDLLLTVQKQQEEMAQRFHGVESALHAQLDELQSQLLQKDNHLAALEDASTSAQRTEETLQSRLAATAKTQNLMESKLEDAARDIVLLQEQLETTSTKYEEVKHQCELLQDESAKKQSHLDEMNYLQEEMLGSVDKYMGKATKARDKVEQLEVELQAWKDKETLAQKQAMDTAQVSEEKVLALQAKLDTAERHCQDLQARCAALLTEKKSLKSSLEEMQQSLQGQVQESSEKQQESAAKEQKCHQMEEVIAELEAALSTALQMMLKKPTDTFETQTQAEDEVSSNDTDDQTSLLDQSVLRDLRTCCQALSSLTTDNGPPQCTLLCPSFPQMISRMTAIGERARNEINRALASWARERTNLKEACSMLDSTARMCQGEMEKCHGETRDLRQQLLERTAEIEAYAMQVNTLDANLRRAEAECEAYHALEQHSANQENVLAAKEALIHDLSAENERLVAVENAYAVQLATNARCSKRLEDQQTAMQEQQQYAEELEHALESAATFAEQQNECNQQLNSQLAQTELSKREQADTIKTLEVQTSAFSSRFLTLLKHYTSVLRPSAATDRNLQEHLTLFDTEVQNGDVLRLLQIFPAVLEEYVSMCTRDPHDPLLSYPLIPRRRRIQKKKRMEQPKDVEMITFSPHSSVQEISPTSSRPLEVAAKQREETQLEEQLELIRGAFQSYKDDLEA